MPKWWLDKVLPMLDRPDVNYAQVAKAASQHARRERPWDSSAISKFKTSGVGRTIELANGISAALQVPQPFFTAPSESAAVAMLQIVKREQAYIDEQNEKLRVFDRVAAREIQAANVDGERKPGVGSTDDGDKSGRGVRAGRASRSRS